MARLVFGTKKHGCQTKAPSTRGRRLGSCSGNFQKRQLASFVSQAGQSEAALSTALANGVARAASAAKRPHANSQPHASREESCDGHPKRSEAAARIARIRPNKTTPRARSPEPASPFVWSRDVPGKSEEQSCVVESASGARGSRDMRDRCVHRRHREAFTT